jgi:tRNA nucleotidyltransferase (CCA-adding enzyme)
MAKLIKIEKFTDDDKNPTTPINSTYQYVTIFGEDDYIETEVLYSEDGWDIDTDKTSLLYYDDEIEDEIEDEEVIATEDNPNREPAGSSKGGQFAKKDGGGSVSDIKNNLQKNIEPTEKETAIQTKIDVDVRSRIQEKIDELGLTDKVDYVETQGSYVKGTDLPSNGSDMDIFVVFNPSVGEEERKDLGLKIGLATLDEEYASSQGWSNFKVDEKDQENKYAEAFFDVDGQTVEVQIVPTRNMDKYDIIKKEINGQKETADGKKISIGMERTPHQTKFMNENLTIEQKLEVRTLKKFMKETGLYDSSVKSQGFSGYSTEVLIHNLGSFENVVDYFADYKMGKVVGLPSESEMKDLEEHGVELTYITKNNETKDKYTEEYYNTHESYKNNSIHITDPIDPNRDIGGAISEAKLAKTILTMKHVKEYGKAPDKIEPTTMNGVSLTFTSSGTDENTVGSQVQSLQNDMVAKLDELGFKVEKEFDESKEIVDGFSINPNRINIEQEKGSKEMTINFGMDNIYSDGDKEKTTDISGMKEQQITGMIMGLDKSGTRYEKKDGKITTYKPRQFKNVKDAMKALLEGTIKGTALSNNNVLSEIRSQNVDPFTKFTKFDNLPN